ncbi:delta-sarcoglycan [Anopheles arabiensis]|uniref:Gamma-sarcoglycan n=1 Tax=Anopheles arabiensis TaxID=7173 RepID=A0A182HIP2_ANOAR|nr:delta-sarcoglycan [Anopheles arabiensis]
MSRYSRDDPRSIFFSGSSSTPLRSYAGSDLLKRTTASSPNPSTSPTPSTSSATPPGGEPSGKPEPVVRIIPILYPAQPARLIGGTSSYGNAARPSPPDGPDGEADAPVKGSNAPTPSQPAAAAAAPAVPTATTGILKSPVAGQAPSGGTGTPSRVSFSARPITSSKPTMAGPSGTGNASGTGNGVHGRTLPLAKTSRSGVVEPPLAAPPVTEPTASGPLHQAEPTAGAGGPACRMQLALYGWRKKCLYALIFVLMVMIIVNLALTLWIMKVMEFSSNGMGQLKIVPGGIQLTGQALVLNTLRASSIRSKHGQPISVESSRNLSINTRNAYGAVENQLFLGHDRLEVLANHFRITDTHGTNLFAVDRDEVIVGAGSLRVEGEGGVAFRDSIQTPLVRADAGKDLKLESPTRSLEARATQEIFIQSRAGGIETTCLNDLKLHSVAGSIRLDSSAIYMPNLKTVQTVVGGGSGGLLPASARGDGAGKIYQLCACSSGKLFLAAPNSVCTADDSAICR